MPLAMGLRPWPSADMPPSQGLSSRSWLLRYTAPRTSSQRRRSLRRSACKVVHELRSTAASLVDPSFHTVWVPPDVCDSGQFWHVAGIILESWTRKCAPGPMSPGAHLRTCRLRPPKPVATSRRRCSMPQRPHAGRGFLHERRSISSPPWSGRQSRSCCRRRG